MRTLDGFRTMTDAPRSSALSRAGRHMPRGWLHVLLHGPTERPAPDSISDSFGREQEQLARTGPVVKKLDPPVRLSSRKCAEAERASSRRICTTRARAGREHRARLRPVVAPSVTHRARAFAGPYHPRAGPASRTSGKSSPAPGRRIRERVWIPVGSRRAVPRRSSPARPCATSKARPRNQRPACSLLVHRQEAVVLYAAENLERVSRVPLRLAR